MNKYYLISKEGKIIPIAIYENVKEDFKKLMEWSELDWRTNTALIKEDTGVKQ